MSRTDQFDAAEERLENASKRIVSDIANAQDQNDVQKLADDLIRTRKALAEVRNMKRERDEGEPMPMATTQRRW